MSSKSRVYAAASSGDSASRMLFSCNVHASSVKFIEPVQTAASALAASRTTYLECISCGAAVMPLVCTAVAPKCSVTHCAVPSGAGSASRCGEMRRRGVGRLAHVVSDPHCDSASGRVDERRDQRRSELVRQPEVVDRNIKGGGCRRNELGQQSSRIGGLARRPSVPGIAQKGRRYGSSHDFKLLSQRGISEYPGVP